MAFDSQQAGRARVAVVVIVLVAVAALAVAVVSGAFVPSAADDAPAAEADAIVAADADDGSAMDSIDAQYGTAAQSLLTQYEADPSNPSALLNLANGYFDWGVAALNHAAGDADEAHARELLVDAIGYYDTYLDESPGAKSATVDRAICLFYTGETDRATSELQDLVSEDPSFAPAWANLGMFFESQGSTDKAADAYQKAIDATADEDPYGVRAYAEERLAAIGG